MRQSVKECEEAHQHRGELQATPGPEQDLVNLCIAILVHSSGFGHKLASFSFDCHRFLGDLLQEPVAS